ncbi:hypothetical protein PTSG_09469 [Salpingoeca rosetta]|uniref:Cilia-and flagella-associated protein 96 n=1 Tax=Salpingoeca rosetta (strain ATCC 50818 / BSB-021) TaxID=946362 RepID=F2UL37_SALR5|nr:uncharacterized protein PTSG_09469 [Salpingoeca rosetta]EGD77836.1 hypothetical protein PTSG_09469 [Salpingoeca rosetta]|eukprot:XP_004989900.1 hypothetical protein PTSG_09469 [Salpingoeca rosetta]
MPKTAIKSGLEMGFFGQPAFVTINDPYNKKEKLPPAAKGRQMMTLRQNRPFDNPPRAFEGEAYHDAVKQRRKEERRSKKKQLTYKFTPSGTGHDTFSGPVKYFSPQQRPQKKAPKEPSNFYTNPSKKGSGFGYANVTLSRTLPYIPSEYDRADKLRRKEEKAAKSKMKGKAFKSVCGNGKTSRLFDDNPFREPEKKIKAKPKSAPPQKKVDIPFKPTATVASRHAKPGASSTLDTFSKFDYKPEPYKKKTPKPKGKPLGPPFRPCAPAKSSYSQSISGMHAMRTAKR